MPAKGHEEKYTVSNLGNVRSIDRRVNTYQGSRKVNGRLMKPFSNGNGYFMVCVSASPRRNEYVHRIVANTFHDNNEIKMHVNHINGNKEDNRAVNLEWCTPIENARHASNSGLVPFGEKHHNSKLNEHLVRVILRLYRLNPNFNRTDVANKLGVADSAIVKIIKRQSWKRVK